MSSELLINLTQILESSEDVTQYAQPGMCRNWSAAAARRILRQQLAGDLPPSLEIEVREVNISTGLSHTFIRVIAANHGQSPDVFLLDGTGVASNQPYYGPEDEAPDHLANSHLDWIHRILLLELEAKSHELALSTMYHRIKDELIAQPTAPLHTRSLESKYGPVSAEVIEHTSSRRVIDIIDETGISRTHAITWFPPDLPSDDPLQEARQEIAEGALIGKTIRQHGFSIKKPELASGLIRIPVQLQAKFQTEKDEAHFMMYQFIACSPSANCLFGVICEIYSPDFMPPITPDSGAMQVIKNEQAQILMEQLEQYLKGTS